ncbi:hypothetical protein [Lysobacter sp. N42]|uniref:hypothetical protein n=1 Tax=Lysobacter sp. N42 TaxID=2545719 RepID=UPI000F814C03|nr:hypothetical protein [Lysobacter sp. N42]RTE85887.1 hypothetical protein DQX04_10595 [Aliidiomarina sp. B3213]TCZ90112.1 hypothetical protein EYQ95_09865 [Lysobacter sp. N42]
MIEMIRIFLSIYLFALMSSGAEASDVEIVTRLECRTPDLGTESVTPESIPTDVFQHHDFMSATLTVSVNNSDSNNLKTSLNEHDQRHPYSRVAVLSVRRNIEKLLPCGEVFDVSVYFSRKHDVVSKERVVEITGRIRNNCSSFALACFEALSVEIVE